MLRHTCAATRGASGAPLLGRAPDGEWVVVGVAAAARADRDAAPQGAAYVGAAGGAAVPASAIDPAAAVPAGRHDLGSDRSPHGSNDGARRENDGHLSDAGGRPGGGYVK